MSPNTKTALTDKPDSTIADSKVKEISLIDLIDRLEKPSFDYPPGFDFKKEYYEAKGKKYGL